MPDKSIHFFFGGIIFICTMLGNLVFGESPHKVIDYIQIIVNSEMLTHSEVQESFNTLAQQVKSTVPSGPLQEKKLSELQEEVFKNLTDKLLLIDRAKELKIEVSDKEVDERIDILSENNPELLSQYGEAQLKEQIVKDIKQQRILSHEVDSKVHVSDQEILELCQQESHTESLGIAQILLRDLSIDQAKEQTQLIHKKLQSGVDFETLARQYSQDPNAQKTGGKLGVFTKGKLLKEIDDVAFNMKLGQISDLVQTPYGYHLIYIYDVQTAQGKDCFKLTPADQKQYTNRVYSKKREQEITKYLKRLRESARIVIKHQHTPSG